MELTAFLLHNRLWQKRLHPPRPGTLPGQRRGTSTALLSRESGGRPWEQSSVHERWSLSKYPSILTHGSTFFQIPTGLSSGSPLQRHKPLLTVLLLFSLPHSHHIEIHLYSNACLRLSQSRALRKFLPQVQAHPTPFYKQAGGKRGRRDLCFIIWVLSHKLWHSSKSLHKAPTEGGEL